MTYIFRINTNLVSGQGTLPSQIQDWGNTNNMGYGPNEIAQIPPSNPNSTNEPTSIPSPFARLALTKTAFAEVATKGSNALMAYQQIVSNSLDVAEIFFNFDTLQNHIGLEIIKWSYSDMQNIQNSTLQSTLVLFLQGDAQSLNLSPNTTFYFLLHKQTGKVIGGTSPRTLFFPAANVKSRKGGIVEPEFVYTDGTFFSKNYILNQEQKLGQIPLSANHVAFSAVMPLSKRDIKFQEYLHTWIKVNGKNDFPEFKAYLGSQILPSQTAFFNNLSNDLGAYNGFNYHDGNNQAIFPEVLAKPFMLKNNQIDPSLSDFIVQSNIYIGNKYPMILGGSAAGIENWSLDGNSKWGDRIINLASDRNTLPSGAQYPWLTAEDFLEDTIIQLPNPIKKEYFCGNHVNQDKKSILLPLKEKFFEFFTVKDLASMIKIDGSSSICVTLVIPLKNNKKVTFVKTYKNTDVKQITTLSSEINFMLFPNIKFNNSQSSFYRFGIFKDFNESIKIEAQFYNQTVKIKLNETNEIITRNENDSQNNICTTYAIEGKEFDHLRIFIDGNNSGVIIPELKTKTGNVDFTFAIDFGTTNTHIEYKTNIDGNIKPFDITDQDEQISWFVHPGERVSQTRLVSDIDFIPEHIGYEKTTNIKVKFPTRTALLVASNATTGLKLPFLHTNIVLPFDKRSIPIYNGVPITQLKWESDIEEVGFYIDNLCYLIRNKVVLNNGNLANTKILWTYPLSMNTGRYEKVLEKWHTAYIKYFSAINVAQNCKNLTESLAPFYYYSNLPDYREYIKDLVSIDIGGGTTDVVFVKECKPSFVTSFRFAANDVFGLGIYVSKIVSKHKLEIDKQIDVNGEFRVLLKTMNSIEQNTDFGDFASFFFSLKDNEDLNEKGKSIDFNKMLNDDKKQKIVFLLFYAAIIYHTAQVMKAKGQSMPRHLTFSGNGSRIVNVIGTKGTLEKVATVIFEKIFSVKYGDNAQPKKLEIIPNSSNPKEVTCKGTISILDKSQLDVEVSSTVLLGIDDITFAGKISYNELSVKTVDLIDKINNQVEAFFTFVLDELLKCEIKKQVGTETLEQALGIPKSSIEKVKEVLSNKEDLRNITKNKIVNKDKNDVIEETFFFLPIPTLLKTISREIENKED